MPDPRTPCPTPAPRGPEPHIRPLTEADPAFGLRLSTQAGWNQTLEDWRRLLRLSDGSGFAATLDGRPVGTALAVRLNSVAWVSMVLVQPRARGRGVARALLGHVMAELAARGVVTARLDATPLGRRLYCGFGFRDEYPVLRLAGRPTIPHAEEAPAAPGARLTRPTSGDLQAIGDLDTRATGADRGRFLRALFEDKAEDWRLCGGPGGEARAGDSGAVRGYLATRSGRNATQLGPWHRRRPPSGPGAGA